MLTNAQKSLLKRAQRQAGVTDDQYRDDLRSVTGCATSSRDRRVTDRHLDHMLGLYEATYWRGVESGELPPPNGNAVFRKPGFWAGRNRKGHTSRDRYHARELGAQIAELEETLIESGHHKEYLNEIFERTGNAAAYAAALRRTTRTKPCHAPTGPAPTPASALAER